MPESNENKPAAPTQGEGKRPKRRWFRRLLVMVCLLMVLLGVMVAFAPKFISTDTGRGYVLDLVSDGIAGRVDADGLTVRWGRGQSLTGVVVSDSSGTRIARIGRIELPDTSLWSIVNGGLALGELEIESVAGDIIGYDDGTTNFSRAMMPSAAASKPSGSAAPTAPSGSPAGGPTGGPGASPSGTKKVAVWPSGLSLGVTIKDVDIVYRAQGATDPVRLVIPEAKLSALDPKHMVLELDVQLSQGGNGGHEGRASADIRIDDLFDRSGTLQSDRATFEVDARLTDLPVDAADQLLGQGGKLATTLGPILNAHVQAQTSTAGGFARVQAQSEHLHVKSRLVFDESGLVSEGPGEVRLTLTPDAWLALTALQTEGPAATLLEPIDINVEVRRLGLPWNDQGLALNGVGFDLGLTISDTQMQVKDIGEVKLTSASVQLVADKLSESVRAEINAGIEYPGPKVDADIDADSPRPGVIQSTTTLAGLDFTPGGLDRSKVTYTTDTHIQRAPIDLIDTLTQQDGELVGALGPRAKVDAVGTYTPSEDTSARGATGAAGGIDLLLKSRTASIDAKLLIADGKWMLKADAPLSFRVTPRLSQTVLKRVNPFLGGAVSAKLPIKVNIRQDGFSAPLQDVSLADVNADVLLELGELDLKGEGVLLKLLQQLGVGDSSLLQASFSPVTISLAGGRLSYKDLVMSVQKINLSFSGQVDLNSERLNLSLSIPGESFAGVSWLKGVIGADQVIVIPLTGTFDKPELDFKLLTTEIGKAALNNQLKGVVGGAIGDNIGGEAEAGGEVEAILGGLLNDLLKGEQADTQVDQAEGQADEPASEPQAEPQDQDGEAKKPLTKAERKAERKARRKRRRERRARQKARQQQQEQASQTEESQDTPSP